MFTNFLKSAYRTLLKNKTSSVISITGLAVGMACCMIILIHIKDELSFNSGNTALDHIYRINWISKDNNRTSTLALTPVPFSNSLTVKIPGIKKLAKLFQRSGEMETANRELGDGGVKRFQEQNLYFTDSDIFSIFSIPVIAGDRTNLLSEPNTLVITEEMARKYFGNTDPLGKSLLYENKTPLRISAVVKKMPSNSDIRFDFLVSFETIYNVEAPSFANFIKNDWTFAPCETWVLLEPVQQPENIDRLLNDYLRRNGTERNRAMNHVVLQSMKDIHLHASAIIANESASDISYIYIFAGIAFLILLIANVNFINLTVARSIDQIKEVGVRKVLGAGKKQLVIQFLTVTLLTGFLAFLLAFILTAAAIPILNQLTNKQFSVFSWIHASTVGLFVLVFFATSMLAGLYPALHVTRFKMVLALRGKTGDHQKKNLVRKVLLVTQFTVSIILIIGSLIIFQQLEYLRNKPLGFQKQQMVVVPIYGTGAFSFGQAVDAAMRRRMNAFSDELVKYNKIKAVTASSEMPGQGFVRGLIVPQGHDDKENMFAPWLSVDYNFIQALHMQLVAGRNFSKVNGTDFLKAFIINESAVRAFGWTPENAIGKTFIRGKMSDGKKGQIIGVVKDFDFNSLSNPMESLVIDVNPPRFTEFAISVWPDHVNETIEHIRRTWDNIFPERVFEYSFLDKDIDAQYKDKENFSRMIEYFTLVAILLSCSGLFSLAIFLAVKRAKEISIRKVLGADIPAIILLLSVDFVKMILLASLIATPVAWWLTHQWLQGFAYHIAIQWWIFVVASLSTVLIAVLTIGVQSVKAAFVNPINSLRSE